MDTHRLSDHPAANGHGSSRDIEHDIERTRHHMDDTLDAIGERLNPRHLFDDLLDLFRSGESGDRRSADYARQAKQAGRSVARKIKAHPVPALLCAAGAAWLLYEELANEDEGSSSSFDKLERWSADQQVSSPMPSEGRRWSRGVAAWHPEYDWSGSQESEQAWTSRAERTVGESTTLLSNKDVSHADKLKLISAKIMSLSGRKRHDLHSQWAELHEHSGSFVDARTGEPYEENYGQDLQSLIACDTAASHHHWTDESDESQSNRAAQTLEKVKGSLAETGANVKDKLRDAASHVREFVSGNGGMADAMRSARDTGSRTWERTRDGTRRMGRSIADSIDSGRERLREGWDYSAEQARHGYEMSRDRLQEGYAYSRDQVRRGYRQSRDFVQQNMEERPLAVGAACVGLGLIVGLLIPESRKEQELLGEHADELKRKAREAGADLVERGERVAKAAASAADSEMEKQGIKPRAMEGQSPSGENLLERGKQVAEAAVKGAKDEAQKQGLSQGNLSGGAGQKPEQDPRPAASTRKNSTGGPAC